MLQRASSFQMRLSKNIPILCVLTRRPRAERVSVQSGTWNSLERLGRFLHGSFWPAGTRGPSSWTSNIGPASASGVSGLANRKDLRP